MKRGLAANDGERLIKRYENRKLYDPAEARYVTVEELGRSVAAGRDVRVVDRRTGEDLTSVILAQVILEGVKERTARVPHQVLARLIRLGAAPAAAWGELAATGDAAVRAREEAERIVAGLLGRGRLTLEEGLALRQEIAGTVQRVVDDAQHGIESRLRGLMDRSDREGASSSLAGLRERLMSFETFLEPAPRAPRKPAGRRQPADTPSTTVEKRRR